MLLRGQLSSATAAPVWKDVDQFLEVEKPQNIVVDASGLEYVDTTGIGLLIDIERQMISRDGQFSIEGLAEEFRHFLDLFDREYYLHPVIEKDERTHIAEDVGKATASVIQDLKTQVAFIGETCLALVFLAGHPRKMRWNDCLRVAETAGVNALPIVALIGFLMGLIMAFQAAIPMRQFGADIFVANLVTLAMVRELGPLMTAIVLAGRSSSAFAAEIGTMKVNEEISALKTMGLRPVHFLVAPRIVAAVAMTPVLTVFASVSGILGGFLVFVSMGYSPVSFYNQMLIAANIEDIMSGLVKAFFFGILVAGVGCLRGLQTRTGASAVGDSTTRAVVSSIILIAVADGVFSIVYYALGI